MQGIDEGQRFPDKHSERVHQRTSCNTSQYRRSNELLCCVPPGAIALLGAYRPGGIDRGEPARPQHRNRPSLHWHPGHRGITVSSVRCRAVVSGAALASGGARSRVVRRPTPISILSFATSQSTACQ